MTAIIAYDTFQNTEGLVTSFTTPDPGDPGLPVTNMLDYATHTLGQVQQNGASSARVEFELSNAATMDYVGIAGHNLPDNTKINIADMTTGSPVFLESVFTVGTGPQLLPLATSYNLSDYRIAFEGTSGQVTNIGSLFAGRLLTLPMGLQAPYTPPPLGRDVVTYPSTPNKGANFLASHVQRVGWAFQLQQNNLTPEWVNLNWLPLARHMEQRPFFYLWDTTLPADAVYGWVDGKIPPPSYTSALRMAFSVNCRGLHAS